MYVCKKCGSKNVVEIIEGEGTILRYNVDKYD